MTQLPLQLSPGAHLGEYGFMAEFWDSLVYDHRYCGNLCGGFGAETKCKHTYWSDDGVRTCGRPPASHGAPYSPRHRKDDVDG